MDNVIDARPIFHEHRALIAATKECLDEAADLIRSGECLETVGAFLNTQRFDGPTKDIREYADYLFRRLQQKTLGAFILEHPDNTNPEPAA